MWEYLSVFFLAATPLVELLVVIPVGIGLGLAPVPVALLAFAGNALPVVAIVALFDRWENWRRRRADDPGDAPAAPSPRRQRAQRVWARYGMPGLALMAPLITGVHLATLAALALGSPRRTVTGWMIASIALWCAAVTAVTIGGIEAFRRLIGG
jgi:Ca2+/H+ antiporter, TMEM165/GDT1 family